VRSIHSKQHSTPGSRRIYATRSPAHSSLKQRPASAAIQLATSAPRPSLPVEQQGRIAPRKAAKHPGLGAGPRPLVVKHGKSTQRLRVAKRGGSAKPAKVHLPKLAALPAPVPGRRTLASKSANRTRPRQVGALERTPAPQPTAPQTTASSGGPAATPGDAPGEDDAPGIDAAGGTAGPDKPSPTRARTPAHEGSCARGSHDIFENTGQPPREAARPIVARTLRTREQA
jgi:hypothetical protein